MKNTCTTDTSCFSTYKNDIFNCTKRYQLVKILLKFNLTIHVFLSVFGAADLSSNDNHLASWRQYSRIYL